MKINTQSGYVVPVAIIVAGVLIAGAVFFTHNNKNVATSNNTDRNNGADHNTGEQPSGEFRMPNESDHVRGNSNAKITIVEYSDFNCSFCARLHPTLSRIVEENEDVQWVYRHFANYAQGRVAAIGSECVAKIGGNDVFWEFSDRMFD
ncbi:MAG: thioredoxin domain-containing protein, partial [Candidatus Spechtbacterales bacterium]